MSGPTVLFVFGMGRSGTSALTRVLSLSGAALPQELLGPTSANERGHWEPAHALDINDVFLRENGSNWYDPSLRLQDEEYVSASDESAYVEQIKSFLVSCPKAPLLVIKEPRIAALATYWMRAAHHLSFEVKFVIPVRRPAEVIGSLTSSPYLCTRELAAALWIKYNLLAERHSRGKARVFVEYGRLLEDWRREVGRVADALQIGLSTKDDGNIDAFLEGSLNHHRATQNSEGRYLSLCDDIYTCLARAARGDYLDESIFDQNYAQYAIDERFFRSALGDFAKRF